MGKHTKRTDHYVQPWEPESLPVNADPYGNGGGDLIYYLQEWKNHDDDVVIARPHGMVDLRDLSEGADYHTAIRQHNYFDLLPSDLPKEATDNLNVSPLHSHADFVELCYVIEGSGVAYINNTRRIIERGDLMCLQEGDWHTNFPLPRLQVCACLISFDLIAPGGRLFPPVVEKPGRLRLPLILRLTGKTLIEVNSLFRNMMDETAHNQPYRQEALLGHLNQLLLLLQRHTEEHTALAHSHRVMAPILEYISNNFSTVTLSSVAQHSNYNPTYLSKLFHDTMGIGFNEYVSRLRIEEAISLILKTDLSIEEICSRVGFKSRVHFYDLFSKYTGCTPGSLRRK